MSISQGPITLVQGVQQVFPDPAQVGGNPSDRVQIQNSSSFILNVITAGDVATIQPFTAMTLPVSSGAPVSITAGSTTVGTAGSVTIILFWLLAGEGPPIDDGPLTAAAIAATAATSFGADVLGTGVSVLGGGLTVDSKSFANVPGSYQAILVVFSNVSLPAQYIEVEVQNTSRFGLVTSAENWMGGASSPLNVSSVHPISNAAGDTIRVYVTGSVGGAGSATITVVGLKGPQNVALRPDGKLTPTGARIASTVFASPSGILVSAPGASAFGNQRVLLLSLEIIVTGGVGTVDVTSTIGGVSGKSLGRASDKAPMFSIVWPAGIEVDPLAEVDVTFSAGGMTATAIALYDLISP